MRVRHRRHGRRRASAREGGVIVYGLAFLLLLWLFT